MIVWGKLFIWILLVQHTDGFDYGGFTYFFSYEANSAFTLTHDAASEFCKRTGRGMLASVTSQAESDAIIKEIRDRGIETYYWIGLDPTSLPVTGCGPSCGRCFPNSPVNNKDCQLCGQCRQRWKWSDGSLYNWTYWHSNQPNNNITCISFNKGTGEWYDQECNKKQYFMCKKVNCAEQCRATSDCEIQARCNCTHPQCRNAIGTTTENSNKNNTSSEAYTSGNNGTDMAMIAGIAAAVGLIIVAVVVVILVLVLMRRRKRNRYEKNTSNHYYNEASPQNDNNDYSYADSNPIADKLKYLEGGEDDPSDQPGNTYQTHEYGEIDIQTNTYNTPGEIHQPEVTHAGKNDVTLVSNEHSNAAPINNNIEELYAVPDKKQKKNQKPKPPKRKKNKTGTSGDVEQDEQTKSEAEIQAMYAMPMKPKKGNKTGSELPAEGPSAEDIAELYTQPVKKRK